LDGGDALQAHAGVNARVRQRGAGSVFGLIVLHEDETLMLELAA
jgi:hypothetical protein